MFSLLAKKPVPFLFLDPGSLQDRELELITPSAERIDDVLAACRDPLTLRDMPDDGSISRQALEQFIKTAPGGRQPGDPARGWLPTYHFWMVQHLPDGNERIAGGMGFRVGVSRDIELYTGNIGYHVYPASRRNHFAERACRLILPLARQHGMKQLWITCNPDNLASRRTCERLGGTMVEILPVPKDHPFYGRGEHHKCRFRIAL